MIQISEQFQHEKLKKLSINIRTGYICNGKLLERNSDDSRNDSISNGIRYRKEYFVHGKLLHTETDFDTRIEYTYAGNADGQQEYHCPNCGMVLKSEEVVEGCPYCGTNYNIDYSNKNLGGKYHYDLALKKGPNNIIAAIVIFAICVVASYFYIRNTSNSFNNIDIAKIIIYAAIATVVIFYAYYQLQLGAKRRLAVREKEKQNRKQEEFWNRTQIDQKTFFNNFNHELAEKYYGDNDIIDYDVLDFTHFEESTHNGILCVEVKADVRVVHFDGQKIVSTLSEQSYLMKRLNENLIELKDGINIFKCPNCGSPVDVKDGCCEHCGTRIRYYQNWEMM